MGLIAPVIFGNAEAEFVNCISFFCSELVVAINSADRSAEDIVQAAFSNVVGHAETLPAR